ncbi:hypothetical protein ASAC_0216 [Acidilobus saccharovorans 345-15]|uniref:Type II secretion system protein GspF domain-containing protein n=1 Tax=Acidilobus saccharovorans (strain DSM 16705 / JCM 18335 / VKM B-2471 / 345-15) TaxID=666510 RepID=D9PZY5_ACIS3|nr:hypothetical protein [Acidilobus saccharovorans]ADL18623.1 hypothetical protein ASAC_0216 [Acidilobus saccharovorans 345-15]
MMGRRPNDPRIYGPLVTTLNTIDAVSPILAVVFFIAAGASYVALHAHYLLILVLASLGVIVFFLPELSRRLLASLLGSGINDEMPSLLAVMIPYVASSRDLSAVLVTASESLGLKFSRVETRRLSYLLAAGYDERRALRILADTTPSSRLREVIRELLTVEEMGLSRLRAAVNLYARTMDAVKSTWQSYAKLGETITEAMTTLIVSAAVLLPLSLFGSSNLLIPLAVLMMVLSPSLAILLALLRPKLGEPEGGWWVAGLTIGSAVAASLIMFLGRYLAALIILTLATIVSEASWARLSKRFAESLRLLREASERARLGLPFADVLSRASMLGKSIINAIVSSDKVAGRVGIGPALQSFVDIFYESLRSLKSLQVEAYILMGISAVAPAISLVGVYALVNYIASSSLSSMLTNTLSVQYAARLLMAMSPLSTLPAASLHRGRRMSPAASLVSATLSLLVVRFITL